MKSELEKTLERKCCRLAEKRGWWHRKFKSPGKRSAPDRIFAKDGSVFFVEFKRFGEDATPLQAEEHEKMRAANLSVYVVDNVAAFEHWLEFYQS